MQNRWFFAASVFDQAAWFGGLVGLLLDGRCGGAGAFGPRPSCRRCVSCFFFCLLRFPPHRVTGPLIPPSLDEMLPRQIPPNQVMVSFQSFFWTPTRTEVSGPRLSVLDCSSCAPFFLHFPGVFLEREGFLLRTQLSSLASLRFSWSLLSPAPHTNAASQLSSIVRCRSLKLLQLPLSRLKRRCAPCISQAAGHPPASPQAASPPPSRPSVRDPPAPAPPPSPHGFPPLTVSPFSLASNLFPCLSGEYGCGRPRPMTNFKPPHLYGPPDQRQSISVASISPKAAPRLSPSSFSASDLARRPNSSSEVSKCIRNPQPFSFRYWARRCKRFGRCLPRRRSLLSSSQEREVPIMTPPCCPLFFF